MYKGTVIEELMEAVGRAEARAEERSHAQDSQEERLAYWYAAAQREVAYLDAGLAGVA